MSGVKTGTVKFFNSEKGFGFIKETATGTEYFVHSSGLIDQINEKDEVEFNTKQGKKGINAVDVRITE
jgi:CspA family cold shock protein